MMNNVLKIDEYAARSYDRFNEYGKSDSIAKSDDFSQANVNAGTITALNTLLNQLKQESGLTNIDFKLFDAGLEQAITTAFEDFMQKVRGPVHTLPSGRKIWRDASDTGSVIEYNFFGETRRVFVADAQHRYCERLNTVKNVELSRTYLGYDRWGDNCKSCIKYTRTDAWLAENFPELKDDDTIIELDNERVKGAGLRLPTLYELMVIYLEAASIDALDPSAKDRFACRGDFRLNGIPYRFSGDTRNDCISLFNCAASSTALLSNRGTVVRDDSYDVLHDYLICPVKTI